MNDPSPQRQTATTATTESTALVLLSFDEREALEKLLPLIPFHLFDRIVAIDPGSTDGTLELFESHEIPYVIQSKRGRGAAFQLAAEIVDSDRIVFFSAEGNENPEDLPLMLRYLDEGYDLVIGGRFIRPDRAATIVMIAFGFAARARSASASWFDSCGAFWPSF